MADDKQKASELLESFYAALERFVDMHGRGAQARLAEGTGMSVSKVSDLLKRKRPASFATIEMIANFYGFGSLDFIQIGSNYIQHGIFVPYPTTIDDTSENTYEGLCELVSRKILPCDYDDIQIRPGDKRKQEFFDGNDVHTWFVNYLERAKEVVANANTK